MNGIAVVIPTFNRPEMLKETLQLLSKQSVAPDEVVVVDNGTVPAAPAGASQPYSLRHFRIWAQAGAAQARNFGAAMAAFLDDDDFWEPDYVERLREIIDGARVAPSMIVGRIDHLDRGDRHSFRFAGDDRRLEACFYFNPGYLGSCLTVERKLFLELGGFDARFETGEDKELAMRYMAADRPVLYDAGLVAVNRVHEHTLSARIDHLKVARLLLQKYRAHASLGVRVKTMREAYKKAGRKRYALHILALKIVLVAIQLATALRSRSTSS
jgi:glycosyltransferase involved in cell wall biosynthesis